MTGIVSFEKLTSVLSGSTARVKSLWEPLHKVLTFSLADEAIYPAKNVSVSIDKGRVSVAYGARALSRIRIRGAQTYPLNDKYPTPESLASSVSLALSNLHVSGADITLSIPKAWVVMKVVEFPSTVKDNLADVISYEMDRVTPFTADQALYDFRIVKEEGGRLTVLLASTRANLITPYLAALRERGCNVVRVTLNLSGLGTFCAFTSKCTDTVLFRVREKEYEAAIFLDGSLVSGLAGSLGSGDERSSVETIVQEMESLMEHANKQGKSPGIILSLKDSDPTLRELLKLRINIPYKILEEDSGSIAGLSGDMRCEAVGGVLESLWPAAKGLNLLKKGYEEKEKVPLTFSVILVAAVLIIWVASIFAPMNIEKTRLKEIQRAITARKEEIRKVEALRKEVEALESEVSAINGFKGDRPMTLEIVKELTGILPRTTWLSRIRITETAVELEGYASSASGLIPKLEASRYFKKVEFASPTFRDARMNSERFNIKMEIEGVKKIDPQRSEGGTAKK